MLPVSGVTTMKVYDYYLFDADGTLFDTTELICECFQYVAEKHANKQIDRQVIIQAIGSPLRPQIIEHLGADLDIETILDDYLQYQLKAMEHSLTLFPKVQETLKTLKESNKKLAIVTSRKRYSLDVFLKTTGIHDYFDALVTPEDTELHKPNPEPALKAIELLGASKPATVFIGDAKWDVCSGNSAGVDTVFVNWSHTTAGELPEAPTWTIDTMSQLTAPLTDR